MHLEPTDDGFRLLLGGRVILDHSAPRPCLFVGRGRERMDMYRGNFDIEDYIVERTPLAHAEIDGDRIPLPFWPGQTSRLILTVQDGDPAVRMPRPEHQPRLAARRGGRRRARLGRRRADVLFRPARPPFPALDLRARRRARQGQRDHLPGRCQRQRRRRLLQHQLSPADLPLLARYALHVETTAYSVFDFRNDDFHEIEVWAVPERIELFAAPTFIELVEQLSLRFGRQPRLPDWVYNGAIVGLKDGEDSFRRLEKIRAAGAKVSGLWCEDWVGLRHTSFGARLFWDWQANETRYPDLRQRIAELNAAASASSAM